MNRMAKRLFDIVFAFVGLLILLPFLVLLSLAIVTDSRGGVFYLQRRVGKNNIDFNLFKFRTMYPESDKKGLLTVGMNDKRITRVGSFLRRYKLDELPQLLNVLNGTMSFVGPRPEVRKYVSLYTKEQMKVLSVKPGITDLASIAFADENSLLGTSNNPEELYINEIMPQKIQLNLEYIKKSSLLFDIALIFRTIFKIFRLR